MIGKTLGHYQITSQLGKGGMGEVYQAKDRKLGRDVAIKVLPEEFARDADRVSRFQREAKLLASLNHPNIAAIHGLEESGGTNFLVLELVEGDTLADRIKRGPIPVEESLKLALQIAEALEAAHEKGVIHRDLKPANIKVTPDGKVKVLDFGLAKAYAGEQAELNLSNSPTLSDMATMQGVILGTAAYMSPEQARGKPVDRRTDVWAFGCVLYEMLTGQAAFQGEDVTEILAAVVKSGVNLELLPVSLHPRVREVLARCLQKEQRRRYSGIGDVQYEIEQIITDPRGVLVQQVTTAKPRKKMRVGISWVAAALILGLVIAGIAVWKLKPPEPRRVIRFDYELPEGQLFSNMSYPNLAISPNGRQFAYSTPKGLYLRSMDQLAAKLITGIEDVSQPFFSPDGEWIGYLSVGDRQLKKISINGGPPVMLCTVSTLIGAHWGANNTIVFSEGASGIMRVSADGGTPEPLIKKESDTLVFPQLMPGEKSVLYGLGGIPTQRTLMVRSLESGETKRLFAVNYARYIPTGHIVYRMASNSNLFAVPFDLDKLEITGGHVPIIQDVRKGEISDTGTLVYIPGQLESQSKRTLVWVDRKGKEEPLAAEPNSYQYLRISPDGTRIAVTVADGYNEDIHIWDIARENMMKLTFNEEADSYPLWTLDSKQIVFTSNRDKTGGVYRKAADGTGEEELLSMQAGKALSLSSDGKTVVLIYGSPERIGTIPIEGDKTIKPLLSHGNSVPQISPDGRWMAYMSAESGKNEVYVRPFTNVNGGKWKVSTGGGMQRWSSDGRELYYWTSDALMVVAIETKPTFKPGTPKVLFQRTPVLSTSMASRGISWDIHPDGKRFLLIKPTGTDSSTAAAQRPKINIVLNWFEELKQRVPVK